MRMDKPTKAEEVIKYIKSLDPTDANDRRILSETLVVTSALIAAKEEAVAAYRERLKQKVGELSVTARPENRWEGTVWKPVVLKLVEVEKVIDLIDQTE